MHLTCQLAVSQTGIRAADALQISPVWYQLRAEEGGNGFKLTGGHDVDQGWIAKLREPVDQVSTCGVCCVLPVCCKHMVGIGAHSLLVWSP